ncbi:MAG: general secretion pathway protein GspK [Robiginitomaculum sp.]|nr:general secretion pathway protein GspK [Robiginitomaculum sp.]
MKTNSSNGFVLPYVLVVIAILAITTSLAAGRLQRISTTLIDIEQRSKVELAFANAEAEAVFSLLTAIDVDGGVDLNPDSLVQTEFGIVLPSGIGGIALTAQDAEQIPPDFWSATGGQRLSTTPYGNVLIGLHDTSGLVSLNTSGPENIKKTLAAIGLSSTTASQLTARLADFRDSDNARQFQGAERADYRLRNLQPPTNSALRSYEELSHVLGWEQAISSENLYRLMDMTTLQLGISLKPIFVTPALSKILELNAPEIGPTSASFDFSGFDFDSIDAQNPLPSGSFRLCLTMTHGDGEQDVRCIEIVREANHVDKPFRRFWVYQRRVVSKDVPQTQTTQNPATSGTLKNVLHTSSVPS